MHGLVSTPDNLQSTGRMTEEKAETNNAGYRCYLEAESKAGNAEIQYMYADALYYGLFGFQEDEELASKWMSKSADRGNLEAMHRLHYWYYMGFLEEDEPKALELLKAAAKGGYGQAQLDLAEWYKEGTVVSQTQEGIQTI